MRSASTPDSETTTASSTTARIARVVLHSPLPQLDRLFDYRIPAGMEGVAPGVRVRVPLRSAGRTVDAFVVETRDEQEFPGPLSDVEALVSPVPVLRPEVWATARAVATRAAGSASDILRLAIPTRQVRVEKEWLARTPPVSADGREAGSIAGYPDALGDLIDRRGRAAVQAAPGVERTASGRWVGRWAILLAEAAARALGSGSSALVAVPDWRDLEQLVAALDGVVPDGTVVRWDARQPNPERYRGLLRAADGPVVVVGTRSVVYAPAADLGLIAIWDDGDPLFHEPLAPYVHARDAALVRQEQQGAALLLAGHSRTTEVQRLVELGWLEEVAPTRRPRLDLLPTAALTSGDAPAEQARIPSSAWRRAREALESGPVLVQVARPGFAPGLHCADCGAPGRCTVCGGPLAQQRAGALPTCRWCGTPATRWTCPECHGRTLRPRGRGSVRTAEELGRAFPGVRIRVADGEHTVAEVGSEPALVVATRGAEPVAAGGYRAVLLLDGERMIARESLRVGEDCLRWWADASALAADGAPIALVGVTGAIATALRTGDMAGWARMELADRRALRFPPAVRTATATGEPDAVAELLRRIPLDGIDVWGPVPVDGGARAILVFDYGIGARVAADLRAETVRQATSRRPAVPPGTPRRRRATLRIRMDDPSPFDE